MTKPLSIAIVAGAVGLAAGSVVGYKAAEKRLADQFERRLDEETSAMREFYTVHRKKYPTPEAAVAELIPENNGTSKEKIAYNKIVKSEYSPEDDPEEEAAIEAEVGPDGTLMLNQVVEHNIFQVEKDPDVPYIIPQDAFMENEGDFEQSTLTYYEKDRKLTDEREELIDDIKNTVGSDFAEQFGTGSSHENTIHIRNERLRMDFEIVKSEGAYAQEVLGMDEVPPETHRSRRQIMRGE